MTCKNTVVCLSSQLDLFKGPLKQICQEKNAYVPHYPLTTLSSGPIEFDVPASTLYTDFSETRLYIKAKVKKADGTSLVATDDVSPVNMLFHAMFSKVDVILGDRLITQSTDTYPWKAAIETLLNFGQDAKKSQLTSIGYEKDEVDAANTNTAIAKRAKRIAESKTFELLGPLHVDLFHQEKYMVNSVPFRVKLTRTAPTFCLTTTDAAAAFKIELEQAILYVRRVKLSPTVEIAHAKAIETCNALFPIHNTEVVAIPIGTGLRSLTKDGLFGGKIPRKLVVGLLSSDSYNGSYGAHPFAFTHHNISRIDVTIDGESVGDTPLEMDFTNKIYLRAYHNLFSALNKSYTDCGTDITYKDFGDNYALFAFDLTGDGCGNTTNHVEKQMQGTLRISLAFKSNLTSTIYAIFFAEFEKTIEVTKAREVLT